MDLLVRDFVAQCLLCPRVKRKEIIQRPFGPTLKSSKRNEIPSWDFLHIGYVFGESKYLLVLKYMATHYCEIVPCSIPNAQIATGATLIWNARFGLPSSWLSDQGTHFLNVTIEAIFLKNNT